MRGVRNVIDNMLPSSIPTQTRQLKGSLWQTATLHTEAETLCFIAVSSLVRELQADSMKTHSHTRATSTAASQLKVHATIVRRLIAIRHIKRGIPMPRLNVMSSHTAVSALRRLDWNTLP